VGASIELVLAVQGKKVGTTHTMLKAVGSFAKALKKSGTQVRFQGEQCKRSIGLRTLCFQNPSIVQEEASENDNTENMETSGVAAGTVATQTRTNDATSNLQLLASVASFV
jgi:hypothetical protein